MSATVKHFSSTQLHTLEEERHFALVEYLVELEQQNPVEEPVHEQEQVSTTDPDSTYATKGGTPARLGYCAEFSSLAARERRSL
jgi:hypothetical protein